MKSLIAVIAALVVIAGGWYWYSNMMAPAAVSTNTGADSTIPAGSGSAATTTGSDAADGVSGGVSADINAGVTTGAPATATVTLTSSGFTPKSVTIKKGGTVTFKNEATGQMWVASASHPTHTVYAGTTLAQHCDDPSDTSFDQCKNGSTYSFTFSKTGSWNYHNHSNASQFGTVVVVE